MLAPDLLLPLLGLAAAAATLAGGFLALRLAGRAPLILGLSAGAVVGVALFDLLPEAAQLNGDAGAACAIAGAAFIVWLAVDRLASGAGRGHLGAGGLTLHSLIDGLAIGLSFQVSAAAAAVVTLAVLAHDLADGINTVNVSLAGGGDRRAARLWLLADAAAPVVGVVVSRFVRLPPADLAPILAAFAGAFLCIGAGELLPASHRADPRARTTMAVAAGAGFIWLVARFAAGR